MQYQYRHYYGAGFAQDDFKVTPRLSLNAGLRWEYVGPSFDSAGKIGNVWPSLLKQVPVPPLAGTLAGNVVAANYRPALINPYTGDLWSAAYGRADQSHPQFLPEQHAAREVRAPLRFRVAAVWNIRARRVRGGYGWFYLAPTYSANAGTHPCLPQRRLPRGSPIPTPPTASRTSRSCFRPRPSALFRAPHFPAF